MSAFVGFLMLAFVVVVWVCRDAIWWRNYWRKEAETWADHYFDLLGSTNETLRALNKPQTYPVRHPVPWNFNRKRDR